MQTAQPSNRPGVTLIEVLVVVAIVSVLVAIAVPVVGRVRMQANEQASVARLHDLSITFELYQQSFRTLPFARWGWALPPEVAPFVYAWDPVFGIDDAWPTVMHTIAPWRDHSATWVSPGAPNRFEETWGHPWGTFSTKMPSYRYARCFVGDSRLWTSGGAEAGERANASSDVAFPSSKVELLDRQRAYLRGAESFFRPVAFADGSARVVDESRATLPVQNPLLNQPPAKFHDTPDGVRGRDF